MVAVADVVVAVAVVLVSCWLCVCVGCICVVVVGAEKHPCVHSKRLRVYIQKVRVCTGTKPTCMKHVGLVPVHTRTFRMYTRRRFERVHGFFSRFFTVPQHTQTHTNTHTKHTPRSQRHHDHTTQHGDRNRERKRDETRQEKRKRDKTRRQDKRREKMKEKREFDSTQAKLTRSRQSKD